MSIFSSLFKIPNELEPKQIVTGLTDEGSAIFVADLFRKQKCGMVYVAKNTYEANQFYEKVINYLGEEKVLLFLMDDFFTSQALAASPELKTMRLEVLNSLLKNSSMLVITDLMGYLKYLPNKNEWNSKVMTLKIADEIDIHSLTEQLINLGYTVSTLVSKTGEIGIRGFVVDIFPVSQENPVRIEFFGDTIESIRYFDVETQLSKTSIPSIQINPYNDIVEKDIFIENTVNISSYLFNPIVLYCNYNQIKNSYYELEQQIKDYKNAPVANYVNELTKLENDREVFLYSVDNYFENDKKVLKYESLKLDDIVSGIDGFQQQIYDYLRKEKTVVLCVSEKINLEKLERKLLNYVKTDSSHIQMNKFNLIHHTLGESFEYGNFIFVTDFIFFHKKEAKQYHSNFKYGVKIKDLSKLELGDYVVHNSHGVGVYAGLVTLTKRDIKKDYLQINYKDNGKLYIPVEKLHLITKFSASTSSGVKVNSLGGTDWQKKKLHIQKRIQEVATQLLRVTAEREIRQGFSYEKDSEEQLVFDHNFPYDETRDQLLAIDQIKKDMEKTSPMDRLLCGDVGFGKTEVAFRAMFKAATNGKQVAFLCPTTILSSQHYDNALERFKEFPIQIELLNRFTTAKDTTRILEGIKRGNVDIVIGTHRLLSKDIVFHDLGLLVVDEEQRFGVLHKEKVKEIKANVDVLTLSATPIPRTLQMSMVGIRNISLIETPPVNRYPVQTYVLEENKNIIRDAIYKELNRKGQIFILFNKVRSMDKKLDELRTLVPEARIVVAHGQLSKSELESRMMAFINKEYDILLCTTIIETGIDIPNANTLIIMDADHFGLAQLYQIRGRVGRSEKIAYAYLMYRKNKVLTETALKRLEVIKQFTELGSGFRIAMRDLSIRGGGDILGSEQAGFIDTIGIELYNKILNDEINRLKGNLSVTLEPEVVLNEKPLVEVETHIEDSYVDDTDLKIEIHNKINEVDSYEKLIEVKEELTDRFGTVSESLIIYMYEEWFEKLSRELGLERVNEKMHLLEFVFSKETSQLIDGQRLFLEATAISRKFRLSYKLNRIVIVLDTNKLEKHWLYYMVDLLKQNKNYIKTV